MQDALPTCPTPPNYRGSIRESAIKPAPLRRARSGTSWTLVLHRADSCPTSAIAISTTRRSVGYTIDFHACAFAPPAFHSGLTD
jgi:hypothetical protein